MNAEPSAPTASQPALESPLPREVLTHLYATMLRSRMLAKRLRSASYAEAILAGVLENAEPDDVILSARPDPVLEVLRGSELASVGGPKLTPRSKTITSPAESKIVAANSDVAAGVAAGMALALRRTQAPSLVLAFLPGKFTRGSAWKHATEFASAHHAPVIFIADWTDSRSSRPHDGHSLSHWPFPNITVDGRDVIAVYRVTKEAIAAARRGHGPTLIDGINFLAPGKRGRDERDAIASFRGYLKRHDAWSDDWSRELEERLRQEIALRGRKA